MTRYVLTDAQWAKMEPHCLGKSTDPSRSGGNNRLFLEAVLWIARTGSPWRDLPPSLGHWSSVYTRFRDWTKAGVFKKIFEAVSDDPDIDDGRAWNMPWQMPPSLRFTVTDTGRKRRTRNQAIGNRAACRGCKLRELCTKKTYRRITRYENEAALERMADRLAARPELLDVRRESVEHPFGTIRSSGVIYATHPAALK